jgi:hypothetical protein
MEGVTKFRVSAYDEKSNMICKDSEVGFDEAMLVEGLKSLILSRSPVLRNSDKNAFQLRTRDGQHLPANSRIVDLFPDCRTGKDISVSVVPLFLPLPRAAAQQQQQSVAVQKDVAVKAAKNVKAMAKLNEDNLCKFLLEKAASDTVTDLAELKKPSGGQKRKGGGSAVALRSMEWTKLYNAIKGNVQIALDRYASGLAVEEGIIVDQTLSLEDFSAQLQRPDGNNNNNDPVALTTMSLWVLDADQAMKACQRLAIANCITLGIRLNEVRSLWDDFKASPIAAESGLYTLEAFYRSLGIEYTVDYVRKLIQMGILGKMFPNLALISCCGIGELMRYSSDFVRMMQGSPSDAVFWRCAKNGMFAWQRTTAIVAYEGLKKRKVFDHHELAEATTFEDWAAECTENVTAMLAEDEAASRLAAAQDEAMDELIEEIQGEMEAEM